MIDCVVLIRQALAHVFHGLRVLGLSGFRARNGVGLLAISGIGSGQGMVAAQQVFKLGFSVFQCFGFGFRVLRLGRGVGLGV